MCLLLIAPLYAGCAGLMSKFLDKVVDDEKKAIARGYVQKLKDGQIDELAAELQPAVKIELEELRQKLEEIRGYIPAGEFRGIEVVGYHVNYINGETTYQIAEQYDYGDKWLVTTVTWKALPDNSTQLWGLHVNLLNQPLQEINALTLRGKTLRHYLIGSLALLIPTFTLTTLIVCIRTKPLRRKWLWMLFILMGLGSLSLNWTTGQMGFNPLSVSILGATVMAHGLYAPWIITISLPLGAICFWLRRKPQPPPLPSPSAPQTAE